MSVNRFSSSSNHHPYQEYPTPFEPADLRIRVAHQQDLSEIAALLTDCFYPQSGMMRWFVPLMRMGIYEDLRQRLRGAQSSGCTCLVAVIAQSIHAPQVIGTVEISLRSNYPLQIWNSHYPYLSNLAVHADYRKQGVAQRLLSACEQLAIEGGFQNLYLDVLENNYPARQLYIKSGYRLKHADPLWCCILLRRSRRLLLFKKLVHPPNVE